VELPKTAMPIKNSIDHWIDVDGNVYAIDRRNKHSKLIKKVQRVIQGYKYCGIYDVGQGKNISRRVHRVVAETFIPNPNHLPVVGHKNNIKTDNRVENLYWTTISENTKKAFDDKLCFNKKGYDDNQSMPVVMFDTLTNKRVKGFGSISEAAKETGIDKTTISRQAKYKRPVRKPYYFRFADDESAASQCIIGMFDYDTDMLENTYIDCHDANIKTGYSAETINYQCAHGKPKHKFSNHYFKYLII